MMPGINYQRLYAYRFRDVDQVHRQSVWQEIARYVHGQMAAPERVLDCADHTLILSHVAVEEHLYAAGFELTAVHPRFLPYSFRGLFPSSSVLTRIYLHTSLAWRLLGKQFLVIARKP